MDCIRMGVLSVLYHKLLGGTDYCKYCHIFWDLYCSMGLKSIFLGKHFTYVFIVCNLTDRSVCLVSRVLVRRV